MLVGVDANIKAMHKQRYADRARQKGVSIVSLEPPPEPWKKQQSFVRRETG